MPVLSSHSVSGHDLAVPDQRQREGVLGLHPGQARCRIEDHAQVVALGQVAGLRGDAAGDRLELVTTGEIVFNDDECRSSSTGIWTTGDRITMKVRSCLPLLMAVSRAWTISAVPRKRWKFLSTRIAVPSGVARAFRALIADRGSAAAGGSRLGVWPFEAQTPIDVPGGQRPAVAAAKLGDLVDGLVVLVGLDPDAREGGTDVLRQALAERHGLTP